MLQTKRSLKTACCLVAAGSVATPCLAQDWLEPPDRTAILAFGAHPDDEGIFFGGTLPYYAQVRNLPTVLVSVSNGARAGNSPSQSGEVREAELRAAAHVYGLDYEPVFLDFTNAAHGSVEDVWDIWYDGVLDGDDAALGYELAVDTFAAQIRRFRPSVVVTHSFEGEYGHRYHRATAQATVAAFERAADESITLLDEHGIVLPAWQADKIYVHEYDTNPLFHTRWETEYDALGGLTPRQIANLALDEHVSQDQPNVASFFDPNANGNQWDPHFSELWGLYASHVGADSTSAGPVGDGVHYGDFLENVDLVPFAAWLADANGDGTVGVQDLDLLLANWGQDVPAGSVANGDADGNGVVGEGDLAILIAGWGEETPIPAHIPEPGACVMVAFGMLMFRRHGGARSLTPRKIGGAPR